MAYMEHTGNIRSSPRWMGDFGSREHVLPVPARLDPTQAFVTQTGGIVVTLTANAAQGATTVAVTALNYGVNAATPIVAQGNTVLKAGTTLLFGGAKVATLTTDALYGATTLNVAALPTALVSGDAAVYSQYGTRTIPSGTFVGRTFAERTAGTGYGQADVAAPDDQLFLTVNEVVDLRFNPDVEFYRHGSLVKENYLPGYGTGQLLGTSASPTAVLTAIRTRYRCIIGRD